MSTNRTPPAQSIRFESAANRYNHTMPNMAEDDLDPFEYRLLGHYIRAASECGDVPESIRDTAAACKMSINTVRKARLSLVEHGYIEVQEFTADEYHLGQPVIVTVLDRHVENALRYAPEAVSDLTHPVSETTQGGVSDLTRKDIKTNTVSDTTEEQIPKDKDSVPKKAARATPPKPKFSPPQTIIPDALRSYFELIAKLTDTSLNSPVVWDYYHLLNGTVSKKRGATDWFRYQLTPGLSEDELRRFMAYQKRQHELSQLPGKFYLRQPTTINNLVNKWRDKVRAQDADRAEREAIGAVTA